MLRVVHWHRYAVPSTGKKTSGNSAAASYCLQMKEQHMSTRCVHFLPGLTELRLDRIIVKEDDPLTPDEANSLRRINEDLKGARRGARRRM